MHIIKKLEFQIVYLFEKYLYFVIIINFFGVEIKLFLLNLVNIYFGRVGSVDF